MPVFLPERARWLRAPLARARPAGRRCSHGIRSEGSERGIVVKFLQTAARGTSLGAIRWGLTCCLAFSTGCSSRESAERPPPLAYPQRPLADDDSYVLEEDQRRLVRLVGVAQLAHAYSCSQFHGIEGVRRMLDRLTPDQRRFTYELDPWGHSYELTYQEGRIYAVGRGPDGEWGTCDDSGSGSDGLCRWPIPGGRSLTKCGASPKPSLY